MKTEYKLMWVLVSCWFFLNGCATGVQVGPAEILPISQQATVTGIYAVKIGAEPLGQVWQNARGLQVVIWPGAQAGAEQLWNFACLVECKPGWQSEVTRYLAGPGKAVTWVRMSQFIEYLRQNGWAQITGGSAVTSISQSLSAMEGVITGFMVVPIVPMMDEPGVSVLN